MSTFENSKTPMEHLKTAGKQFAGGVVSFCLFIYTGVRWLFENHPNYTWLVIALAITVCSHVKIYKARVERDSYSQENATLIDSISRMTMQKDSYMNLNNTPTSVIKTKQFVPYGDSKD